MEKSSMSIAERVRGFRYSKGWTPSELAGRAEISRTALYLIERGKTGLPRVGTLRRIALALEVPIKDLLGDDVEMESSPPVANRPGQARPVRTNLGWVPAEGGPMALPTTSHFPTLSSVGADDSRFGRENPVKAKPHNYEAPSAREGDLMFKLHDLLHSPLGGCITGIVDELHGLLCRIRTKS
jgi:transcriptional regulator with XRE-family HTH domain